MRRTLLLGGLLAATLALGSKDMGQAQFENPAQFGWLGDLKQAKQQARQSGKPMFVVFRCQP